MSTQTNLKEIEPTHRGTILLIDPDAGTLFDYWYLFSRSGFNVIQIRHPEHILSSLINKQFKADLIVSSVNASKMHWIDCLSMAKRSGGLQPNLQSVPVILYGTHYEHVDVSFAYKYFQQQPEPRVLLETVAAIIKQIQIARAK